MLIDKRWKNIAKGNTAFVIGGGPSIDEIPEDKLKELIKNNFTVAVNHNIKFYDDLSMYVTADNQIARKYFEFDPYVLYDIQPNGTSRKNEDGSHKPVLEVMSLYRVVPDVQHLQRNKDAIKVLITQYISDLNEGSMGGQINLPRAETVYTKNHNHVWNCVEYKEEWPGSIFGVTGPVLASNWPMGYELYGNIDKSYRVIQDLVGNTSNTLEVRAGGNIMSSLLQILYHMGFDKVVTIGWGDDGISRGYEHPLGCECGKDGCLTDKPSSKQFEWSQSELDSIIVHKEIWGDRLQPLLGGEVLRKQIESYDDATDWENAQFSDLENNLESKNELMKRIKSFE